MQVDHKPQTVADARKRLALLRAARNRKAAEPVPVGVEIVMECRYDHHTEIVRSHLTNFVRVPA